MVKQLHAININPTARIPLGHDGQSRLLRYVPFEFCRTGLAASDLHEVLRPGDAAPLFAGPN